MARTDIIRDISQITALLFLIPEGKADVINDKCVLRERGGFLVEGNKNRLMAYNRAAERLARVRG